MNFALIARIAAAIPMLAAWPDRPPEGDPRLFDARVRPTATAYPSGTPAVVVIEVVNVSGNTTFLTMDHLGLPSRLEFRLSDSHGVETVPRDMDRAGGANDAKEGPPPLPRPADLYKTKPGERVLFRYDLARLFDLRRPGAYRLEVREPGGPLIGTTEFEIVAVEIRQKLDVEGACEHPLGLFEPGDPGAVPARVRLEIGEAQGRGGEVGFAILSNVAIMDKVVPHVAPALAVPVGTRVESHALDVRGQLWAVLAADGRKALVVWDLKRGRSRTVILWGEHAIELGSTPARPGSHAKVVIAGLPGKAKLSTLDDAPADDR